MSMSYEHTFTTEDCLFKINITANKLDSFDRLYGISVTAKEKGKRKFFKVYDFSMDSHCRTLDLNKRGAYVLETYKRIVPNFEIELREAQKALAQKVYDSIISDNIESDNISYNMCSI